MNYLNETKEIENQPWLKNFNLSMILTCNIFTFCMLFLHVALSNTQQLHRTGAFKLGIGDN